MPTIFRGPASVRSILWGVSIWIAATSAFAQSEPPPALTSPLGIADDEQIPEPNGRTPIPEGDVVDYETLYRIIREEVQAELAKEKASAATASEPEPETLDEASDRTLTADWVNGFVAESKDKAFRFHIGGRLEFDNSWFNQDGDLLIGSSADQEMLDGTLMHRARFRTDGRLHEWIDFACEVNFANIQDVSNVDNDLVQIGSVGLTDFYVTFREMPYVGNVRVGHLQAPISLERYSSSNAWYYMERSSMFDAFYNPNDYQNGVVLFDSYFDDRATLAASAAWIAKNDIQSFGFGAHEGKYGIGARVTALPIDLEEERTLLHVGAGYFEQALVDNRFSVASRPLLRSGAGNSQTPNLLFTGTFFSIEHASIANVETALVAGPFSLSSEFAVTRVADVFEEATLMGPRGDVTYQAAYVEGGLFLTPGDQRQYDRKTGTWTRTIPKEDAIRLNGAEGACLGLGAVQLVARYTYLDLVDGEPILTPTSGGARAGQKHDVTLGVNWYLNSQTWFMVNFVTTRLESVVPGADGDIQGIGCRLHLDF